MRQYEAERNRPVPPPPPPPRLFPHAWIGCVLYVLVLIGVAIAISRGLWRLDAFELGALDGERMQRGEWWRAFTALTLHVDAAHLALNLGAGAWFGYLAGRQLGVGTAWLLIVFGAATANLLEGTARLACASCSRRLDGGVRRARPDRRAFLARALRAAAALGATLGPARSPA